MIGSKNVQLRFLIVLIFALSHFLTNGQKNVVAPVVVSKSPGKTIITGPIDAKGNVSIGNSTTQNIVQITIQSRYSTGLFSKQEARERILWCVSFLESHHANNQKLDVIRAKLDSAQKTQSPKAYVRLIGYIVAQLNESANIADLTQIDKEVYIPQVDNVYWYCVVFAYYNQDSAQPVRSIADNKVFKKSGPLDLLGGVDKVTLYPVSDGAKRFRQNDHYGFIIGDTSIIPASYSYADDFSEGYAMVRNGYHSYLIDKKGNILKTQPANTFAWSGFAYGFAVVSDNKTTEYYFMRKDGSYLKTAQPSYYSDRFKFGLAPMEIRASEFVYIDTLGNVVRVAGSQEKISNLFVETYPFSSSGVALVNVLGKGWMFIDTGFNRISKDDILHIPNPGTIIYDGFVVTPCIEHEKAVILKDNGRMIGDCYDEIPVQKDGFFICCLSKNKVKTYGVITIDGVSALPVKYDKITYLGSSTFETISNGIVEKYLLTDRGTSTKVE